MKIFIRNDYIPFAVSNDEAEAGAAGSNRDPVPP
jgi:hypothetical protein